MSLSYFYLWAVFSIWPPSAGRDGRRIGGLQLEAKLESSYRGTIRAVPEHVLSAG